MNAQEEHLIGRIQAGDKEAFRDLVSVYRQKAFGLCFSIVGNTEDAKDVLQESFIKAFVNIEKFRQGSSFYTWFYRIVVNTSRDHLRKRYRENVLSFDESIETPDEKTDEVLVTELRESINEAVKTLPEKQRICFVMKHINGMKIKEIAVIVNCRPSTVKIHLFRAVRNLQKRLEEYATVKR